MPKIKARHKPPSQKTRGQTTTPKGIFFSRRPYGLTLMISLFFMVAMVAVFWPLKDAQFINFDDDHYVTGNPWVKAGITLDNFVWSFTTTHASNWHPLTWISHMLDVDFYGMNPGGHHFTNLLFHIAATVLLFLALKRMTKRIWESGFVAALFAFHPLHVESLAWVSERKDVLSAFFWMLTLWFYIRYIERPKLERYLCIFFSLAMGLLSKPMLVTLPFVLLLLDYWPLGRFPFHPSPTLSPNLGERMKVAWPFSRQSPRESNDKRSALLGLILEKVPLFILAFFSSLMTFIAQEKGGAVGTLEKYSFGDRTANALVSYIGYICKMIWPQDLAIFYPYSERLPLWEVAGAFLLLAGISIWAIRTLRKYPYSVVGWLWYLGTLVPVIGLVQVGNQSMADRYTYLPLIGLFIMIVWAASDFLKNGRHGKVVLAVSGGVVLFALVVLTRLQVHHWQNNFTLYEHALKVTANNHVSHNNLGLALFQKGKIKEAADHYTEALRIRPNYFISHYNLAIALVQQGKIEEAISHYKEVLRLRPDFLGAYNNLALTLIRQGKHQEAVGYYGEALRINPRDGDTHFYLAVALSRQGKMEEAITHYAEVLRIKPDRADVHNNLALLLTRQGKVEEAISHYSEALRIKPDYADAHYNIGNLFARQGKYKEAANHFAQVLRLKPGDAEVHYLLGFALAEQGKTEEAIAQYTAALRIKPDFAEVHLARGLAYLRTGNRNGALKEYEILKTINPTLAHTLLQRMN